MNKKLTEILETHRYPYCSKCGVAETDCNAWLAKKNTALCPGEVTIIQAEIEAKFELREK